MIAQHAIMPHISYPICEVHEAARLAMLTALLSWRAARNDHENEPEESMTAYLISLALAGLVAIVIWEGVS
jgi:hypothetical protein